MTDFFSNPQTLMDRRLRTTLQPFRRFLLLSIQTIPPTSVLIGRVRVLGFVEMVFNKNHDDEFTNLRTYGRTDTGAGGGGRVAFRG